MISRMPRKEIKLLEGKKKRGKTSKTVKPFIHQTEKEGYPKNSPIRIPGGERGGSLASRIRRYQGLVRLGLKGGGGCIIFINGGRGKEGLFSRAGKESFLKKPERKEELNLIIVPEGRKKKRGKPYNADERKGNDSLPHWGGRKGEAGELR